jgi:hypothetical protein
MREPPGRKEPCVRRRDMKVFEVCDELWGRDHALVAGLSEAHPYRFGEGRTERGPENEGERVDGRATVLAAPPTLDSGAVAPAFRAALILGCLLIAGASSLGLSVLREQGPSASPDQAKPERETTASRSTSGQGASRGSSKSRQSAGRSVRRGLTQRRVSAGPASYTPRATRPASPAPGTSQIQRVEPGNEFSFER